MLVFTGCSSISLLDAVLMQMTTKFVFPNSPYRTTYRHSLIFLTLQSHDPYGTIYMHIGYIYTKLEPPEWYNIIRLHITTLIFSTLQSHDPYGTIYICILDTFIQRSNLQNGTISLDYILQLFKNKFPDISRTFRPKSNSLTYFLCFPDKVGTISNRQLSKTSLS